MDSPVRVPPRWRLLAAFLVAALLGYVLAPRLAPPAPPAPPAAPRAALAAFVRGPPACRAPDAGPCEAADAGPRAGGERVGGARVRLFGGPDAEPRLIATVLTDARGQARFEASPGVVWLLAEAPGRARVSRRLRLQPGSQRVELSLPLGGSFDVLVTDAEGGPIVGARALLQTADPLPRVAVSNAEGRIVFRGLVEPLGLLRITAQGYESADLRPAGRQALVSLRSSRGLEVRVVDERGEPCAGARVWVAGAGFWPPRRLQTDPAGRTTLHGLAPGSYDFRARDAQRVSSIAFGVRVPERESFGLELVLRPGVHVHVRVVDAGADRAPVVGADVVLVEGGLSSFPLEGRTDERGEVSLGPMLPGASTLSVRADGFVSRGGVAVLAPPDAATVETRVELSRGGRISGRVVDARGWAVDGASLEVVGTGLDGHPIATVSTTGSVKRGFFEQALSGPTGLVPLGELGVIPGPLPLPGMPPPATAPRGAWRTGMDGRFELDQLPPGRLRLLVRHPDFAEKLGPPLSLSPGGSATVTIELDLSAALSGRVLDSADHPVEGARVDAVARTGTGHQTAITDRFGSFSFASVPHAVDLLVARPGNRHRFVLREPVALSPGERRRVELVVSDPRAAVVVSVQDAEDVPIERARVSLLSTAPEVPYRSTDYTDEVGEASFADAAGLPARLRVVADGYRPVDTELAATPVAVVLTLESGVLVVGRVTHVRGRQVVAGARVTLRSAGASWTAVSDASGEYSIDGVPTGRVEVSVSHPDFSHYRGELRVRRTERPERPFELPPIELEVPGSASGVVVDSQGEPVAGARVGVGIVPAFLPLGPNPEGLVETDVSGRFHLERLAPGPVTLSAYSAGHGRGQIEVSVRAGVEASDLELRLAAAAAAAEPDSLANLAVTLGWRRLDAGVGQVVIVQVPAASEAARSGVLAGDVLESVDGRPVTDLPGARRSLGGSDGSDLVLGLRRAGRRTSIRTRRERVRR